MPSEPAGLQRIWEYWKYGPAVAKDLHSRGSAQNFRGGVRSDFADGMRKRRQEPGVEWRWIDGRRHLVMQNGVPALLPCDEEENKRLASLHHVLKYILRTNCVVSVNGAKRILDEMAMEHAHCRFHGLDVTDMTDLRALPKNCSLHLGDILRSFPFSDNYFDVVHQRFMRCYIPDAQWPHVVKEMFRVARPNGRVVLIELNPRVEREEPHITRLFNAIGDAATASGVSFESCRHLDSLLVSCGFVDVQRRVVSVSLGETDDVPSRLMQDAIMESASVTRKLVAEYGNIALDEYDWLLDCMPEYLEAAHAQTRVYIYTARKPRKDIGEQNPRHHAVSSKVNMPMIASSAIGRIVENGDTMGYTDMVGTGLEIAAVELDDIESHPFASRTHAVGLSSKTSTSWTGETSELYEDEVGGMVRTYAPTASATSDTTAVGSSS
ncbi:S-adenosyl-L-methionine-dependent methyltransferase [Thamnocephalis sphaerospora]|uniref:S-adenosyl-L-methionine-dependent methyltransferase n=1 Tax=Thamnocephalis sphaerospora TaxID=78915 RepID=A0A4P9XNZ3_9FUNG|nr:S-adenosyl-L-methionine-dependent methyltransferase [Thamnocephalis sphaerospora]|eukprot:RKP07704.1 S-adenosyl-L-methionine-dependent methyltransferase [Thamnocephalis sphaerospora]